MTREKNAIDDKGPAQPNRPAGEAAVTQKVTAPVERFDPKDAVNDRRHFANGDTDRSEGRE